MIKKWWHEKVAYQIYPKSFCDSNGDGIGDLQGIISKLDYLKDLGIDIVWISPFYSSPLADEGYDISDYRGIDPRFGTLEDLDLLLEEAKKRDISIVLDLVVNHCSDEHEWFKKACEDPYGKYGRYFYIEKKPEDGSLPCNWRSYFGGPVWDPLPGHDDLLYFHAFHKKQPDLNWENEEVRNEIYDMMNWWLDRGVAGFRIDAIINIKKVLPWKSYPADRIDGLCSIHRELEEASGIGVFLNEMADRTFRPHQAFSVGEVFNIQDDELPAFIGDNGYFETMFDFNAAIWGASMNGWYDSLPITPDAYRDCCFAAQAKTADHGFHANIIENHDEPRGVSRYLPQECRNSDGKKMLAAVMFMLRGLPFLYQGQEIGMENVSFGSIDEIDDTCTLNEFKMAMDSGLTEEEALRAVNVYSRDNARTPYQWNGQKNAGFTTGTPWLKINPNYTKINLANQIEDPESVYSWYRKLIRLRKDPDYRETIVWGDFSPLWTDVPNLMAFYRTDKNHTLLTAANFSSASLTLPENVTIRTILLHNGQAPTADHDGRMILGPSQVMIAEIVRA